ncbi:Protein yipf2 [Cichlidogyrus casuarinus]|uniref:Protein yipf2 n=1 Tax=Cichlidogyrus casuarinus TaxID=1844966 RepID=A0ABD2Q1M5_9PLAT
MVYIYWWVAPLLVWGVLKVLKTRRSNSTATDSQTASLLASAEDDLDAETLNQMNLDFADLLAVFGYSFAILIPVSILWIIQRQVLQWILCAVATTVSSALVACTFWHDFQKKNKKVATILLGLILGMQFLFSLSLMFLFFSTAPIYRPDVDSADKGIDLIQVSTTNVTV